MSENQIEKPEMFATVATPEGNATVVGFLDDFQAEVRYPNRNLRIWPVNQLTVVESNEPPPFMDPVTPAPPGTPQDAYKAARAAGLTPTVPVEAFGDEMAGMPEAPPKRSTIADKVAKDQEGRPTGKSGRPLSGAALAKRRAKEARERG